MILKNRRDYSAFWVLQPEFALLLSRIWGGDYKAWLMVAPGQLAILLVLGLTVLQRTQLRVSGRAVPASADDVETRGFASFASRHRGCHPFAGPRRHKLNDSLACLVSRFK